MAKINSEKLEKVPFTKKKVCKNQLHRRYYSISSKVRDSKTQSQIQSNSVITITVIANSRLWRKNLSIYLVSNGLFTTKSFKRNIVRYNRDWLYIFVELQLRYILKGVKTYQKSLVAYFFCPNWIVLCQS